MCCFRRIVGEKFTEFEISCIALQTMLSNAGMTIPCHLFDSWYYYLSHEDWGKVFREVLLNMPAYTTEKFDCDDFALLVKARVSERYHLNSVAVIIGDTPQGRHGFNMFLSEQGLSLLEPQTGDVFNIGERGYIPDFAII